MIPLVFDDGLTNQQKDWLTDWLTDGPTDGRKNQQTDPVIEMQRRI